ncbi:hypothetical protein NHQ30_008411 [Ciborinia camelliae]|nr:hypothetical protein NHQ30_008411 [Ciborinia camelliae]
MTTINNTSEYYRKINSPSYPPSRCSPASRSPPASRSSLADASQSNSPIPSPTSRRVISSRERETPQSSPGGRGKLRKRKQKVEDTWENPFDAFWQEISSPATARKLRNALLIFGLISIFISVVPWRAMIERSSYFKNDFEYEYDIEKFERELRKNEPIIVEDAFKNDTAMSIRPDELVAPLSRFKTLELAYYFDSLQVAYGDIRHTVINLTQTIPDGSANSVELGSKLKHFREHAWDFYKDIEKYRKDLDTVILRVKDRGKKIRQALSKVKREKKWKEQDVAASKEGIKIADIWLSEHERFREEATKLTSRTGSFQEAVAAAIKERKDLGKTLQEVMPRMIKEAETRQWENFDFPSSIALFKRLSGSNQNPRGYELLLKSTLRKIQDSMSFANDGIDAVAVKLKEFRSPTRATELNKITIPPLEDQIREIDEKIQELQKVAEFLDGQKKDLEKRLKGKKDGSWQKQDAYDYVLSGTEWDEQRFAEELERREERRERKRMLTGMKAYEGEKAEAEEAEEEKGEKIDAASEGEATEKADKDDL